MPATPGDAVSEFTYGIIRTHCPLCGGDIPCDRHPDPRLVRVHVLDRDPKPSNVIVVEPDAPAILANRLVCRLKKMPLSSRPLVPGERWDEVTEALADEIHQDVIDHMRGRR